MAWEHKSFDKDCLTGAEPASQPPLADRFPPPPTPYPSMLHHLSTCPLQMAATLASHTRVS